MVNSRHWRFDTYLFQKLCHFIGIGQILYYKIQMCFAISNASTKRKEMSFIDWYEKRILEFSQNDVFEFNCSMPCATMGVSFSPMNYGNTNLYTDEAYVKMYLLSVVKVQTSYWSYPIISLLAEVGGYLGLLLGMSLLDITKIIDWLYYRFV